MRRAKPLKGLATKQTRENIWLPVGPPRELTFHTDPLPNPGGHARITLGDVVMEFEIAKGATLEEVAARVRLALDIAAGTAPADVSIGVSREDRRRGREDRRRG